MRKLILFFVFTILAFHSNTNAQSEPLDSTGFPGDNLSLEATLEVFKKSSSLEDFEKRLNSEDEGINNLDLNEDGKTDYIRIVDNMDGDVHAIVLQTYVNKDEVQDIAVIEIEKRGKEDAMLQIVGDEDVYGSEVVVEPYEDESVEGKGGPADEADVMGVIVNVWFWPSVRFVYVPTYRPYVSPWYWAVYPRWWRPWRPRPLFIYRPRVRVYHVHYRVAPSHRVVHAHRVYKPHRRTSVVVHKRTTVVRKNRSGGVHYQSKTTTVSVKKKNGKVTGAKKVTTTTTAAKKGNKAGVKKTTTTTKVGKKGNKAGMKRTKTTTKAGKRGKKTKVKRTKTKTTVKRKRRH